MTPAASILIPTRSAPLEFLSAAVQSALLQTVPVEVCVVQDGLEGESREPACLDAAAAVGGTVKFRRQEHGGVASALNACLGMATADWIAWLPADDLFTADHLEVMLAELGRRDGERAAYCSYEEGVPIPQARWPAAQFPGKEALMAILRRGCFVNAATVVWHRHLLEAVGGWDERLAHCQDFGNVLACAERANFLAVHHYGVRRRIHPGQMLQTLRDPAERARKEADMAILREQYGVTGGVWVPEEPA